MIKLQNDKFENIVFLKPTKCNIKEELNGMLELELEHPFDEDLKYKELEIGLIIFTDSQHFRIYKINKDIQTIKVYAKHLSYDLLDDFVEKIDLQNTNANGVISILKSGYFNISSDLDTTIIKNFKTQAISTMGVIINSDEQKDSVLKTFGGFLKREGFEIFISKKSGEDNGFKIKYGKNLIGISIDEDYSDYANLVIPVGQNGLRIQEKVIGQKNLNGRDVIKILDMPNATTEEELRHNGYKLLDSSKPKVNIKVNFQILEKTEEYKGFEQLQSVKLGDTVTIINEKMNFRKKATVISYNYNCLTKSYDEIELGDFAEDISSSLGNIQKSINLSESALTLNNQILSLIKGKIGIENDSLYITVTGDDFKNARSLFKFSKDGLEYSTNGINGNYRTIIDSNGNIRR